MQNELNDQSKFINVYKISGKVIYNDKEVEDIYLKVNCRFDNPSKIMGLIKCNKSTWEKLAPILVGLTPFKFISYPSNNVVYFTDQIFLKDYSTSDNYNTVKIKLELHNFYYKIYHSEKTSSNKKIKRSLKFQLSEPSAIWETAIPADYEFNSVPNAKNLKRLNTFHYDDFVFYFYKDLIDDNTEINGEIVNISKYKVFLRVFERFDTGISDDELQEKTLRIVDDLILLTSFVSTKSLVWSNYFFNGRDYKSYYFKSHYNFRSANIDRIDLLIEPHMYSRYIALLSKIIIS